MPNPFDLLEQDHREVADLLERLSDSEPGADRDQMVAELAGALDVHMKFEEQAIYPLVQSTMGAETAEEANIEHGLAREGVAKMAELASEPGFGAAVEMVTGGIKHHVEEEEEEIFPALRSDLDQDQQAELAAELLAAKEAAGMPVPSLLAIASKDELYEQAREAEIAGRSSMTKDELAKALEGEGAAG